MQEYKIRVLVQVSNGTRTQLKNKSVIHVSVFVEVLYQVLKYDYQFYENKNYSQCHNLIPGTPKKIPKKIP
jgi:hypothetical protein